MRDWLVAIRKDRGMTQKAVATEAGITGPSMCEIEKGDINPSVETAKRIAAVLDFPWTRFFE